MKFYVILFYFFALFFFASSSYAWGPGAHIDYSLHALSKLVVLSPLVIPILEKYKNDFLYGSIAADIILGKKFAGELYHCHHWEVALPLLNQAEDERQQAFVYGYLTHLAVDTVSHNYFVPWTTVRSYDALTLRHTYWEMRFDLKMPVKVWDIIEDLINADHRQNDKLLARSLKQGLFSFKTTKKIFDSLLLLQRMKKWRAAAALMAKRSTYTLSEDDYGEFRTLCHESAVDFLTHLEKSKVLHADPAGKLKLLYAKEMATKLRQYTSRGLLSHEDVERLIEKIRISLRKGIYQPVELPEIYDIV